jgi:signal transduction histidine kinase
MSIVEMEEKNLIGKSSFILVKELLNKSSYKKAFPLISKILSGENINKFQLDFRDRFYEINVQLNILVGQIVVFFRDITEMVNSETALRESNDQVRALARHIESVREEEKVIIAREIHDELGQALTAFKIDLSWLSRNIPEDSPKLKEKLGNMTLLANEILLSIKKISSELRPGILEDLGLQSAFEWHIAEFNKRTGISCVYNIKVKDEDINPQIAINLFRILQEALTNVVKHSGANEVSVNLNNFDNFVKLLIKDNGSGIDLNHKTDYNAFGLIGIKERVLSLNGKMNISGIHKKGTTIEISIPLNNELKNK